MKDMKAVFYKLVKKEEEEAYLRKMELLQQMSNDLLINHNEDYLDSLEDNLLVELWEKTFNKEEK